MPFTIPRRTIIGFLAAMLLINASMWWQVRGLIGAGYPDFTSFYAAGTIVARGLGRSLFDEALEWRVQQEFAAGVSTRKASLPYVHAPFEAILFVPFSRLSYSSAYLAWNAVNVSILICIPLLLRRYLRAGNEYGTSRWVFLSLAFLPIVFTMIQGQDALLLLLVYCSAYVFFRTGAEFLAGCSLAAGLFRFHLIIPFMLILFIARKWKVVAGFAAGMVPVMGLSAAVVGWRGALNYPLYIWNLEQHTGRGILLPRDTPNFRVLLEDALSKWFTPYQVLVPIVILSAIAILLAAKGWQASDEEPGHQDLAFALSLVVAELVSYHTFIYDFSALFLAVLLIINYAAMAPSANEQTKYGLLLPVVVLFFSPLYLFVWLQWRRSDIMGLVLLALGWALVREISQLQRRADGQRAP